MNRTNLTLPMIWIFMGLCLCLCACDDPVGGVASGGDGDEPIPERDVITVDGQIKAEFVGAGPPSICDWGDGRVVVNLRIKDRAGDEDTSRVVLPNAVSANGQRVDELLVDGAISLDADSRLVVPRFDTQVCGAEMSDCPDEYECANTTFCERAANFSVALDSVKFVPNRVSFRNLSVALIIDESEDMGVGDQAQDPAGDRHFAAKAFLEKLTERFPDVEVGLYTFGGEGRQGVSQVIGYTKDYDLISETLLGLEASGGDRPLFDAMLTASEHLKLTDRDNAVMVVITGGPDEGSTADVAQLDEELVDTPVFFVHLGGVSSQNQTLPDDELIRLACRLGGNYYYELQSSLLRKSVVFIADIIDGVWTVEVEAAGLLIDPKAFTTLSATMRMDLPELGFSQTLEFEGGAQGFFGNRLFLPYR